MILAGDLLLYGRKKFSFWPRGPWGSYAVGRTIMRLTNSHVGHAAIVSASGCSERVQIVEAHYPCVQKRHVNLLLQSRYSRIFHLRPIGLTNAGLTVGLHWLDEQVGGTYDINLIDEMRRALKENGLDGLQKLRMSKHQDQYWICSELAASFYAKCGLDPVDGVFDDLWVPTPEDLLSSGKYAFIKLYE